MLPLIVLGLSVGLGLYAYLGYPALLKLLSSVRRAERRTQTGSGLPRISIMLPVYNEADVIAATLKGILALDYPADRRQILVVSDGSTDRTNDIVSGFSDQGVELLGLPKRHGKSAAENAARRHLTGEIVITTDASVRVHPEAVRHLVAAFADPSVGVASGRDISVADVDTQANAGEGAYVGYEMWTRDMETNVSGIVGASGCLYAIRADLHMGHIPDSLSRDFAAALTAREHGLRAVSVADAICFVPRGTSLRQEYRRKVRTITRGLSTLAYKRALLNPLRYGSFAWMLFSHKLCRWLVPWAMVSALAALGVLAFTAGWARVVLTACGAVGVLAGMGWLWPDSQRMPRGLALPAYAVAGSAAVLHAWLRALSGQFATTWEPTRRAIPPSPPSVPRR